MNQRQHNVGTMLLRMLSSQFQMRLFEQITEWRKIDVGRGGAASEAAERPHDPQNHTAGDQGVLGFYEGLDWKARA